MGADLQTTDALILTLKVSQAAITGLSNHAQLLEMTVFYAAIQNRGQMKTSEGLADMLHCTGHAGLASNAELLKDYAVLILPTIGYAKKTMKKDCAGLILGYAGLTLQNQLLKAGKVIFM